MAIERFFRRFGFRRDPTAPDPRFQEVHLPTPVESEHPDFHGLEKYPDALKYLYSIGVYPRDLAAIYPDFEDYAESEFDDHGHAFRYMDGPYQHYRLDRVIFPSDTHYPYMLAADREMRYAPHRQHSIGLLIMPERRIRMNVYPDTSVSLQLQTATEHDLTNFATYFVDPEGNLEYSERAMRDSHFLYGDRRSHEERPVPQRLDTVKDPYAVQAIPYFAEEYLEREWNLTEADIAIPSAELARDILTAPVELGVDLKAMLEY